MLPHETVVQPKDVIRSFLSANKAKRIFYSKKNISRLAESFDKIASDTAKLPTKVLHSKISDKRRLWLYLNHNWRIKNVPLKYVGPWFRTGDLPEEWCALSVVDTAERIKTNEALRLKSIEKIINIQKNLDIVLRYYPPILIQGGEVRTSERVQSLPLDSEDGSHRCIAAALSGKQTVTAYVGFP
ncbi:hypothetical protein KJ596_01815 [Patescibacteria group bacterium]|nr:hypothetical protein [Patescibacteria group bacterium]MBU1868202.1 hypothetical protein [Patescibacteria group bacterium]